MRVCLEMVEFFGAVCVADVSPVPCADAVIIMVMCGDGGPWALCRGIAELRQQAVSFLAFGGWELAEFREGWVDIEKFGGFGTAATGGDLGTGEDEWHAGGAIPERVFSGNEFFAEVPAMI